MPPTSKLPSAPKKKPSLGAPLPAKSAKRVKAVAAAVALPPTPIKVAKSKTLEDFEIDATIAEAASFRDAVPKGAVTKKTLAKLENLVERLEPTEEDEEAEEEDASSQRDEDEPADPESWEPSEWRPQFTRGTHISSILLASRNSGKSYLAKYLIEKRMVNKFDLAFIICGSPKERDNYVAILEGIHVYTAAFADLPEDLWERIKSQQQARKDAKLKMLDILVLFDDSVGNKYSKDVLEMYTCGRHHNTTCFYLIQAVTLLSPTVRQNTDILILLKAKSSKLRDTIIEQMLRGTVELGDVKGSEEKKFYLRILAAYAKKQGDALVLDCRDPSQRGNSSGEELFRFRAPPPSDEELAQASSSEEE